MQVDDLSWTEATVWRPVDRSPDGAQLVFPFGARAEWADGVRYGHLRTLPAPEFAAQLHAETRFARSA